MSSGRDFARMTAMTGRVTIVTGASRGIGRAIATRAAADGATVVAAARDRNATDVVEEIKMAGGTARLASVDVTDAESVVQMVNDVVKEFGRIDVLVNNAGITRDQLLMRMKKEDWDTVLQTNLTGAFICSQAVLRTMVRQRFGRIITVSSVVGQMGNAGQVNYAASKAGLIGFAKSLAREVASRNITVNVVTPGIIETDMTQNITASDRKEWLSKVPLGRLGAPDDVAAAVCFLASDAAAYVTGQVLGVNGGMYM